MSKSKALLYRDDWLSQVLETDTTVLLDAHGTVLGLWGPAQETSPEDRFDPFRVGLDHLAWPSTSPTLPSLVARATGGQPEAVADQAARDAVTGRFTQPQEVADLVLLLASDRAGNVTGANFVIDGGLTTTL